MLVIVAVYESATNTHNNRQHQHQRKRTDGKSTSSFRSVMNGVSQEPKCRIAQSPTLDFSFGDRYEKLMTLSAMDDHVSCVRSHSTAILSSLVSCVARDQISGSIRAFFDVLVPSTTTRTRNRNEKKV